MSSKTAEGKWLLGGRRARKTGNALIVKKSFLFIDKEVFIGYTIKK